MTEFSDVIKIRKVSNCAVCSTYEYHLPTATLTESIGHFLQPLGELAYNLEKCKIIRMENDIISIFEARVGQNNFRVKFKKEPDKYKELFDIHLAAFLESELKIIVTM